MKYIHIKIIGIQWIGVILFMAACKPESIDMDIKKQLALKAKSELNYAGLLYSVDKGVVTLGGKCPTEKAREEVLEHTEGIARVNQVIDQIQVAPVVIETDYTLKSAVDSVLANYPQAMAEVQDSVITLRGQVRGKQLQNLLTGVDDLHPKQIHNFLLVQEGS